MPKRSAGSRAQLAFIILPVLAFATGPLIAQNENETVGLKPNHVFESGQFGENIDTLNGGLNLTTPLGQRFQVDARLAYGLSLSYNSKVWDSTYYKSDLISNPDDQIVPYNEGPLGIGFNLGFGRIFVDYQYIKDCDTQNSNTCWTASWKWVSRDGTQHDFYFNSSLKNPPYTEPNVSEGGYCSTAVTQGCTLGSNSCPSSGTCQPGHCSGNANQRCMNTSDCSQTPVSQQCLWDSTVFAQRMTNDLSYTRISGPSDAYCYGTKDDGTTPETGCFRVETPDGLIYTLVKRVDCVIPPVPPNVNYQQVRTDNQSFCGWYTKLIEDSSLGQRVPATGGPMTTPYPNNVKIGYDHRSGFEHALASITDSTGRAIVVHNCEWNPGFNPVTGGDILDLCKAGSKDPNSWTVSDRSAVATYAIDVPTVGNSTSLTADKATYGFMFEFTAVKRANLDIDSNFTPVNTATPVLKLVRLDYPPPSATSTQRYSIYFNYTNSFTATDLASGGDGDYGEVTCRTLPLLRAPRTPAITGNACSQSGEWTTFKYSYGYYTYVAEYLSNGGSPSCRQQSHTCSGVGGALVPKGTSRQIVEKRLELPSGMTGAVPWRYRRDVTNYTNPFQVVATDPQHNDTVYFYNASQSSTNASVTGNNPEDGSSPEWTDGINYRIDYYRGSSTTGQLVRSEMQEYDADRYLVDHIKHAKSNVRTKRTTTQHFDDGGATSVSARDHWDDFGHWGLEVESGFEVDTPRTTRSAYQLGATRKVCTGSDATCSTDADCGGAAGSCLTIGAYYSDLLTLKEVSDGHRVLSRTENEYDTRGRLKTSIERLTLPATIGAPGVTSGLDATRRAGDQMTQYTYYSQSGNLYHKTLSTGRVGDPTYTIEYTWAPAAGGCATAGACGGYLASKAFLNGASVVFKSIDRDRDANTGLILSTRDTSHILTNYSYDTLGRVTQVAPAGEDVTQIDYASLVKTTVIQGTRGPSDLDTGTDFLLTNYLYDGMGRLVATQKRPADPSQGYSCQKTQYDIQGRVLYKTESKYLTDTGCVPLPVPSQGQCSSSGVDLTQDPGTEFDFREPGTSLCDPFGRVRLEIPADADRSSGETNRPNWPKVTRTDYFGASSKVTVNAVAGANGTVTFSPTTAYLKDALGRLITVDSPTGRRCTANSAICSTDTDCGGAAGSCVATDGGADAYYTYDAADRLKQVRLTDNAAVTQTRNFEYDGLGRLLLASNPENGTTSYQTYDALGNPLLAQDARGNLQRSVYDFAGRLKERWVTPAGATERLVARNTYDEDPQGTGHPLGKMTKVESFDDDGVLQLTETRLYDGLGARLSQATHTFSDWNGAAVNTRYIYNTRGQISELDYPRDTAQAAAGSPSLFYAYTNGVVSTASTYVSGSGNLQLGHVTYNAAGGVVTVETPGGGESQIGYDSRNRPSKITIGKGSYSSSSDTFSGNTYYQSGAYGYDGAGNIYQIGNNRYGYDAANRLITAHTEYSPPYNNTSVEQFDETFNYDIFGNIYHHALTTLSTLLTETEEFGFSTPNTNRVMLRTTTMGTSGASPVNFLYDVSGNVLEGGRRFNPGGGVQENIQQYQYGATNHLLGVQQIVGATLSQLDTFVYDSVGDRIGRLKADTGIKTYSIRDASGQTVTEFRRVARQTDRPEWTSDYIYLAGRLLSMQENLRPEPPSRLWAQQSHTVQWRITLNWTANSEPDVSGYVVYRKRVGTDSDFVAIATPTATTYLDTFFYTAGQTIQYQISCTDTNSNESARSAILVISGDTTAPSTPTLSKTEGDGQVTLTFSGTDNASLLGYYVYRGLTSGSQTQLTPQLVPGPTFTDMNLANGTTYYYKVQSKDTSGNLSAFSSVVAGTPRDLTPPGAPQALIAASTCGSLNSPEKVHLQWQASPAADGVATYEIYKGTQPDGLTLLYTLAASAAPSYDDSSVAVGTTYFYAVKAVDAASPGPNRSLFSAVVAGTIRDSSNTPQVHLFAQSSDGSVTIHWQPAEGASPPNPVPPYYLYRKLNTQSSCSDYVQVGLVGATQSGDFPDTTVPNNAAYDYALVASVNGNESSFSKPTLGIPLDRPSYLYQCLAYDPWNTTPPNASATMLQWVHPSARFYQPMFATTTDGTYAYLKGYHLYHHKVCDRLLGGDLGYQDNSPTREVVIDPTKTIDPYLIDRNTPTYLDDLDPRYMLDFQTLLSPPFEGVNTDGVGTYGVFGDCGSGIDCNCVMPRAVYKVYANGTWLTRESDWPDYFQPFQTDIQQRCSNNLKHWTNLPLCTDSAANPNYLTPPTSVTATSADPGDIRISWTAPAIAAGKPRLAGYYVYARDTSQAQAGVSFRTPLPFAVVGPGETSLTVGGLQGNVSSFKFRVAAFDDAGRVSLGNPETSAASPGVESALPRPPASLHTVLWTVNDATIGRSRGGIKLSWGEALKINSSDTILGFRVYRSAFPQGPYCALLDSGTRSNPLPPQVVGLCTSDVVGRTVDQDAYSAEYSAAVGLTGAYWDQAAASDRLYYYRVTQLEFDGTSNRETPFDSAYQVAGKGLTYDPATLPPPQGFRAWAPQQPNPNPNQTDTALEPDRKGIYLRWCPIPAAPDLPTISEYRVYRKRENYSSLYYLLARLNPSCMSVDANGNMTNRCVIDNQQQHACVDYNNTVQTCIKIDPVLSAPNCGATSGTRCAVVDLTMTCWPLKSGATSGQAWYSATYLVTAVTSDGVESMPSNEDHGWLNYCANESNGTCVPRQAPSICDEHRDPDGNGDYMVCGDENVRLMPTGDDDASPGIAEVAPDERVANGNTLDDEHTSAAQGFMAPHRVIGQTPPPIPAGFRFYHLDHLGSPRVLLGLTGDIVTAGSTQAKHNYLPFGEERPSQTDPTINRRMFTGHERDRETGLDYMLARYYSSSLGRFMAVDPGDDTDPQNPQSWNKYTYVRNNPLSHADPTGTMGQDDVGGWGEATKQLANGPGIVTVGEIGKAAGFVKIAALVSAPILGFLSGGPAAAGALVVARWAGNVETSADLANAAHDPSSENLTKVGEDAIGYCADKSVGYVLSESGKTSVQTGEAIGEGIATVSMAAGRALAPAIAPSPGQPQRPSGSTTGAPGAQPAGQSGASGGKKQSASAVDRKVQAIKDKAK